MNNCCGCGKTYCCCKPRFPNREISYILKKLCQNVNFLAPWPVLHPTNINSRWYSYMKVNYPFKDVRNGIKKISERPMGKLSSYPLSGSCRFAGPPYGACRPCNGAYRSRGPFGTWLNKNWPENLRPCTPAEFGLRDIRKGCRPYTPCYRTLCKPCKAKN